MTTSHDAAPGFRAKARNCCLVGSSTAVALAGVVGLAIGAIRQCKGKDQEFRPVIEEVTVIIISCNVSR